ncbi:MAG: O-antigen ligase family protein [Bacteroidia bacterium]|nr:O-antigen ligase family protein [Bacteroidia bacterium]
MTEQIKLKWLYLIGGIFILINTYFIAYEFFWLNLLPGVFLVVMLALFSMDKLLYMVVFFTPLSITLKDVKDFGVALSVPTEPLLFGITLIFVFRYLYEGYLDRRVVRHPVTIAILFYLGWMLVTCVTSEMPLVSLKHFAAKLWFIIPFYFLAIQLFREKENINKYLWAYLLSFTIVILYTLINHAQGGFREQPAHVAMTPFYNDHTSYGAMLAMFFPLLFVLVQWSTFTRTQRLFAWMLLVLFAVALVFSYTRAAWVSLAGALLVFLVLWFRIKLFTIGLGAIAGLALLVTFQDRIFMRLEKNKKASSTDFTEHIQSISNISTDASNMERINRWQSALRMFRERPFFGWGPGTYMFQYAPFQFSYEKTYISTNMGDRGNAHSEYIGPLAESGVLGMLSFVMIGVAAIWKGVSLFKRMNRGVYRNLIIALLLGLITYFVHGALNNFLDTDKASAPFWGFMAILVAWEVYHQPGSEETGAE